MELTFHLGLLLSPHTPSQYGIDPLFPQGHGQVRDGIHFRRDQFPAEDKALPFSTKDMPDLKSPLQTPSFFFFF